MYFGGEKVIYGEKKFLESGLLSYKEEPLIQYRIY